MRVPWPMTVFRGLFTGSRLLICGAFGMALFLAFPAGWGHAVRSAIAWVLSVGCFLALTVLAAAGSSPERLRARARSQDSSRWVILALIVLAATVSLGAVAALLHKQDAETFAQLAVRVVLVGGVVLASWSLTHTVFALHYAHGYYGDGPAGVDDAGGLLFPGSGIHPDFWDFFYFSLVIGMTCQVSDVQITGRHMRRLAAMHGVLSFFFNTVILALTVNFLVNAVQ